MSVDKRWANLVTLWQQEKQWLQNSFQYVKGLLMLFEIVCCLDQLCES